MKCSWEWIDLPALPCRYGDGELRPTLGGNHGGFRLGLSAVLPDPFMRVWRELPDRDADAMLAEPSFRARLEVLEEEHRRNLPARDAVSVALVVGGERIAIATPEHVFRSATCKSGSAQYHGTWSLPWPADPLADLAVAIRVDDTEQVIGVPYGVCRDESLPVPSPSEREPAASLALVWQRVDFVTQLHLGPYHATLRAASASPGVLAIEVYRDADEWSPPPVTMTVDGRPARRVGEIGEPDYLRRVVRFDVAAPGPRRLARVVTHVAGHAFEMLVPSSLL